MTYTYPVNTKAKNNCPPTDNERRVRKTPSYINRHITEWLLLGALEEKQIGDLEETFDIRHVSIPEAGKEHKEIPREWESHGKQLARVFLEWQFKWLYSFLSERFSILGSHS